MHAPLENCKIFHFHGPKAEHIDTYVNNGDISAFFDIYQYLLRASDKNLLQSAIRYYNNFLNMD
jgi:hypothetical protein